MNAHTASRWCKQHKKVISQLEWLMIAFVMMVVIGAFYRHATKPESYYDPGAYTERAANYEVAVVEPQLKPRGH